MNQLERYLARALYRGLVLALVLLVTLFSFGALAREFDDVGQGSYRAADAFLFVALTMPRRALDLLPVATLVGTLFGLGAMSASAELVAMRALGFSRPRIMRGLLVAAIPVIALTVVTAEWIAPGFERAARGRRTAALTGTPTVATDTGFWFKDGASRVRVGMIGADGMPGEIMIFGFEGRELTSFLRAASSRRENDGGWSLVGVERRLFSSRGVKLEKFDRLRWTTTLSGPELELLPQAPESLAPTALLAQIRLRRLRGQDASGHELALWRLFARPLSILAMLLLALPFVFGGLRDASLGRRTLLGAVLGVLSYVFEQAAGHAGLVIGLQPAITALAPPALIAITGGILYVLRR